MVLMICFVCFPLVNFSSKWQIIPQYTFDRLVMPPWLSTSAGETFQWRAVQLCISNGRYHDRLGSDLLKKKLVAFIFLLLPATEHFLREHVTERCFGESINLSRCPWRTVCFSSCSRQITHTAYSSHTAALYGSKTTSGWLCPDDQIATGHRRQRRRYWPPLPNIYVLFGLWVDSLCPFGRYTYRQINKIWQDPYSSTQLNLRPVPAVCSCLREVLSALTIWPWTCAKLLSSSCIKH